MRNIFSKHIWVASVAMALLAGCGGGGGSPGTVSGGSSSSSNSVGSVSLTFSATELKSAGVAGSEITVTALVKSSTNTAMSGVPVTFSADSGALAVQDAATDANGQVKAILSTSGDKTNRRINVTASASGKTASGSIDVVGTTVSVGGATSISLGSTSDFTVSVKDSANGPVANVPVSITSRNGNSFAVKSSNGGTPSTPLTNSQGQVVITMTGSKSGTDTFLISAQGTTTQYSVNVNAAKLTVAALDSTGTVVTTANTAVSCLQVLAHYEVSGVPQAGTVNISTSRGILYSDAACTKTFSSSGVALVAGDSQPVYLASTTAGVATLNATVVGGPSAQSNVEFTAPLTSNATISLQAEPAIIGANTGSGTSEQSTLTAIVRDGVTKNPVKGAVVEFTLLSDKSVGALSSPATATTEANGTASVSFIAGTGTTPKDGVQIQAKIQGTTIATITTLTVTKKSLFISAGTGNQLATPSASTYQQEYSVFVTDAAGNPVPNVTVTASVVPTRYKKGFWAYDDVTLKAWSRTTVDTCVNEDTNLDGIYTLEKDTNLNGKLDPGLPVVVTSNVTTDSTGTAKITLTYPRNQALWLEVKILVRGSVAGTESTYQVAPYFLPILASDIGDKNINPPGVVSPYGTGTCNLPN